MGVDLGLQQFQLGTVQGLLVLHLFVHQRVDAPGHFVKAGIQRLQLGDVGFHRGGVKVAFAELLRLGGQGADGPGNAPGDPDSVPDHGDGQQQHTGDHGDDDRCHLGGHLTLQAGHFAYFIVDKFVHVGFDQLGQARFAADVALQQIHPLVVAFFQRDLHHVAPQVIAHIQHAMDAPAVIPQGGGGFQPVQHGFGIAEHIYGQLADRFLAAGQNDVVIHARVQHGLEFLIEVRGGDRVLQHARILAVDGYQHHNQNEDNGAHHRQHRQQKPPDLLLYAAV